MQNKRTKKTLVIDAELHKQLRIVAAHQGLTMTEIVEQLIDAFLQGMKNQSANELHIP